jgi:hypothetical protein
MEWKDDVTLHAQLLGGIAFFGNITAGKADISLFSTNVSHAEGLLRVDLGGLIRMRCGNGRRFHEFSISLSRGRER